MIKCVFNQSRRCNLLQAKHCVALFQRSAALLEGLRCRTLLGECKQGAYLNALCTQHLCGKDGTSAGNTSCGNQWQRGGLAHLWNQCQGSGLLSSVVPSGFKTFCHDGIHSSFFALAGKLAARHHVCHLDASRMELGSVFLGTASRSEYNLHSFINDNLHQTVYLRVHQWYVDAPWLGGGSLHLSDVFYQCFWVHGACTQQSQSTCVAHCGSQAPATAPYHASLYNWLLNAKEFTYSVSHVFFLFFVHSSMQR